MFAFIAAAVLVFATAASGPHTASAPKGHPSGLTIIYGLPRQAPLPEDLAIAWSDALELARQNPTAIGYPRPDRLARELVLPATSPAGDAIARAWSPRSAVALVQRRTEQAHYSWAQLEQIKEAAFELRRGLPVANAIYMIA